jgi:farnesyl-diphosphate farnesyltransferase
MTTIGDKELIELLAGVSRSFVLTIRALPKGLRRPIGLAYLLARTSDTIADTATAPVDVRIQSLKEFSGSLPITHLASISPGNPAERHLLQNIPRITAMVDTLPESDRAEIRTLLQKITEGQRLDLLRFPDPGKVSAIATAADLDQYTYLVAGCVGEFWTRICAAHIPRYSSLDLDVLSQLGRAFGQGLQLVNILRDIPEDLNNGRCYLPISDLRAVGISDPARLVDDPSAAQPVFDAWRRRALDHHAQARQYIGSLRPIRIRFACLLPWAIGLRTLALLEKTPPLQTTTRIKVPRAEVRRITRRALWAALSNNSLERWARDLE